MATVEIDEVEFKANRQLRAVADAMMRNPKSAKLLEQARKIIDPAAPTPVTDREREQMEPIEALRKELEDEKAARAAEKAEREKSATLSALRSKIEADKSEFRRAGWTDDGIAGVEKLMEEKGMLDFRDAAVLFEKANPPPAPATPGGGIGGWGFMDGNDGAADIKKMIETRGEYEPIADKLARDALAEIRGATPQRR